MLITDILVHSNRRRTDAYCQGQRSECVGGWSRLFSLPGHSSSGSIQMPKSSIVWPHSNNTIVPSGSDCASLCNAGVTTARVCLCGVCTFLSVCLCSVLVALWVLLYEWVCVRGIVCLRPSSMRLHFPKWGGFSAGHNNVPSHWNAAGQMPKPDPVFHHRCLWSSSRSEFALREKIKKLDLEVSGACSTLLWIM